MNAVEEVPAPSRWSWVSCPNPFYLLSAACVLHSSCWSLPARDSGMPPLIVPSLVAGYTLVLALTTLLVVRRWKVWDDARSMLVMILILCVDLALIGDEWLIVSPDWGARLHVAGFLFSVGITELILHGLRLRLSWLWRGPHYLQMALVFLWPSLVTSIPPDDPLRRGLIHLYFLATGLSFGSLWFAARSGPDHVTMPPGWKWPIHPWAWFIVNSFTGLARGFSMTLSLDPVFKLSRDAALNQLQSIADWSFLTPLLLAWSVVVFECGHRSQKSLVRLTGLLLAWAGVLFSIPHAPLNGAQSAHMTWLGEQGVDLWSAALVAGITCFLWMDLRGSRGASWSVLATLLALGVTDGDPGLKLLPVDHWSTVPLWVAAVWWIVRPTTWHSSGLQLVAAALFLVVAYGEQVLANPVYSPLGLVGRLLELVIILLVARGADPLAKGLRADVMLLVAVHGVWLLGAQWFGAPRLPPRLVDIWLVLCGNGLIAWRAGEDWTRQVAIFTAAVAYLLHLSLGFEVIETRFHWTGWRAFASGLLLLHVGVAFSIWKSRNQDSQIHLSETNS